MKTKSGIYRITKAAIILVVLMIIQTSFGQSFSKPRKKAMRKTYRCEDVGVQKVKHIQGRAKVNKAVSIITPSNTILTASIIEIKPELIEPQEIIVEEKEEELIASVLPEVTEVEEEQNNIDDNTLNLLPLPVYFRYDSYRLDLVDLTQISLAVNCVKAGKKIQVVGHTDNWGSERYNQALSLRRANIIRDMMIELGCNPEMITAKGEGEKFPAHTNEHEVGRQNNRRVEFVILETK